MKIVIPFDGSPSAARAVDHVIGLAQRLADGGVSVDLLNVQNATAGLPGLLARDAADLAQKLAQSSLEEGARILAEPLRKLEQAKVPVKSTVLIGEPASVIASVADDRHADAVVMGTRGLGKIGGLVLGSVASKVVHLVDVPVTLVK